MIVDGDPTDTGDPKDRGLIGDQLKKIEPGKGKKTPALGAIKRTKNKQT